MYCGAYACMLDAYSARLLTVPQMRDASLVTSSVAVRLGDCIVTLSPLKPVAAIGAQAEITTLANMLKTIDFFNFITLSFV